MKTFWHIPNRSDMDWRDQNLGRKVEVICGDSPDFRSNGGQRSILSFGVIYHPYIGTSAFFAPSLITFFS